MPIDLLYNSHPRKQIEIFIYTAGLFRIQCLPLAILPDSIYVNLTVKLHPIFGRIYIFNVFVKFSSYIFVLFPEIIAAHLQYWCIQPKLKRH